MNVIPVKWDEMKSTIIELGYVGENLSTQVCFECDSVFAEYPDAVPGLFITPPKGNDYPGVAIRDGNNVLWNVTSGDLANKGKGEVQLSFVVDTVVKKSATCRFSVEKSIMSGGEPPDPITDWLQRAEQALGEIPATIRNALETAKQSGAFKGDPGYSPTVQITDITNGHRVTITDEEGTHAYDVFDGGDGVSPSVSTSAISGGTAVTITDRSGNHTFNVYDGANGVSPDLTVTDITNGHRITIVDVSGTNTFDVMNGQQGSPGDPTELIDDTDPADDKVFSSAKVDEELTDVKTAIQGKQDSPETVGTAGQVLGLDNNLKPVWKTASGGSVVDGELDKNSTNPVENSVIAEKFEDYDDVLLMRTNQLLDYKNCTQHNATMSSAAGMSTSTHGKVAIIPVSVDANTTITVHRTIVGKRFSIGLSTSENPAIGESIRAYTEGNNNAELSLTATSSDKTLLIYYYLDTQDTTYTAEQLLSAIMVNYGAYIGYEPYLADAFISKKESEYSLVLGEEMFPSSAPTWEGDGWQENTSMQYTHISGGDYQPLKISIPQIKADTPYLLEFDIESNTSTGTPDDSNAVYPSLRGSTPFSIYYGYTGNVHYSFTIFTGTSGSLATTTLDFQPCSATVPSIRGRSFDGTIKNISLKEVLSVRNTNHFLLDQNGKKTVMLIQTEESLRNTLIGFESGRYVSTGYENVALGNKALRRLTSGYWNVGIGAFALEKCAEGSRNIAIGYNALQENTGGDRDVAIGSYALCRNWGFRNVAIGSDCLWYNTKGYQNAAVGMATLHSNTEGNNNAAYGVHALHDNVTGNENGGIGVRAGYHSTGDKNTAVGYDADISAGKSNAIAIGHGARATKTNQIVIGNADSDEVVIGNRVISFNNDGTVTWTALS